MKLLIYTLLLISIISFSCQNTKLNVQNHSKNVQKKVGNIALYYELVHEAELAFIQNKYGTAVEYYLAAKEEFPLLLKDVEHALLIAVEAKDYASAVLLAERLLEQGVPQSYFEKRQFFQSLINSEEWTTLEARKKTYKQNESLNSRIDRLIEMDQKYRYDDYYMDTMMVIDSIIEAEILDVFENYGYPNAAVIGITMQNDTTIGSNRFEDLLPAQIKRNRTLFLPILEDFLHKGELSNHFFETNGKILYPSDSVNLTCLGAVHHLLIQVKDELYTCCCDEENLIDSTRKMFYLEPLKEVRLKAEFYYERDKRFGFGGRSFSYPLQKGETMSKVKAELTKLGFVLHKKLDSEKPYFK